MRSSLISSFRSSGLLSFSETNFWICTLHFLRNRVFPSILRLLPYGLRRFKMISDNEVIAGIESLFCWKELKTWIILWLFNVLNNIPLLHLLFIANAVFGFTILWWSTASNLLSSLQLAYSWIFNMLYLWAAFMAERLFGTQHDIRDKVFKVNRMCGVRCGPGWK